MDRNSRGPLPRFMATLPLRVYQVATKPEFALNVDGRWCKGSRSEAQWQVSDSGAALAIPIVDTPNPFQMHCPSANTACANVETRQQARTARLERRRPGGLTQDQFDGSIF